MSLQIKNAREQLLKEYNEDNVNSFMSIVKSSSLQTVIENVKYIYSEPTKGASFVDNLIKTNEIETSDLNMIKEQMTTYFKKAFQGGYDNKDHMNILKESIEYLEWDIDRKSTPQYLKEESIYKLNQMNVPHTSIMENSLYRYLDSGIFNVGESPITSVEYATQLNGLNTYENYMNNDPGITLVKNTSMVLNLRGADHQVEEEAREVIFFFPHSLIRAMFDSDKIDHHFARDLKGIIHKQLERINIGISKNVGNQSILVKYRDSLISAETKLDEFIETRLATVKESLGEYITLDIDGKVTPNANYLIEEIELDNLLKSVTDDEISDEEDASGDNLITHESYHLYEDFDQVNESVLLSMAAVASGAIVGGLVGQQLSTFLISFKSPELKKAITNAIKVSHKNVIKYAISNNPETIKVGIEENKEALDLLQKAQKLKVKGLYADNYMNVGIHQDITFFKISIATLTRKLEKLESKTLKEHYDPKNIKHEFQIQFIETFMDETDEITVESFNKLLDIAFRYDSVMEAGAINTMRRNVALGAEKASKGLSNSVRKMQTENKRVQVVAKKVPEHIDRLVDDTIGSLVKMDRNERRKRIIEGGYKTKLMKLIKVALATGIALHVSPALAAIGLLVGVALNKKLDKRVRNQIVDELETELRLTKEKVEDARTANDKQKKYQLMRIQDKLEKDIVRIKYNLKELG